MLVGPQTQFSSFCGPLQNLVAHPRLALPWLVIDVHINDSILMCVSSVAKNRAPGLLITTPTLIVVIEQNSWKKLEINRWSRGREFNARPCSFALGTSRWMMKPYIRDLSRFSSAIKQQMKRKFYCVRESGTTLFTLLLS